MKSRVNSRWLNQALRLLIRALLPEEYPDALRTLIQDALKMTGPPRGDPGPAGRRHP